MCNALINRNGVSPTESTPWMISISWNTLELVNRIVAYTVVGSCVARVKCMSGEFDFDSQSGWYRGLF